MSSARDDEIKTDSQVAKEKMDAELMEIWRKMTAHLGQKSLSRMT